MVTIEISSDHFTHSEVLFIQIHSCTHWPHLTPPQVHPTSQRPCPSGSSGQPWQWVHHLYCSKYTLAHAPTCCALVFTVLTRPAVTGFNFSHRIDHLSFGEAIPGLISPLDGTEKITDERNVSTPTEIYFYIIFCININILLLLFFFLANYMFQYFITIVPTKLNTYKISADTHQYSVTERVGFIYVWCV